MSLSNSYLLIVLLTIFTSCGTAKYKTPKLLQSSPTCKVTVFRDNYMLIYSMDIKVAGVKYAKLSDHSYTTFEIATDKKIVETSWFPGTGGIDHKTEINCVKDKEIYIAYSGGVNSGKRISAHKFLTKEESTERMKKYKKASE